MCDKYVILYILYYIIIQRMRIYGKTLLEIKCYVMINLQITKKT